MEVIEVVKSKLKEPKPDDLTLEVHIAEVEQSILNYLNSDEVPMELEYVFANMVVDFINRITRLENDTEGESEKEVSSIKEGDVTVQFKATSVDTTETAMKKLIYDYTHQLNKFRKMRW